MANLVKFNEVADWDENGQPEYKPAYVDIDSIQYIYSHPDDNPKHCMVVLKSGWSVGLDVDMDHLAALVNKEVTGTKANFTEELVQELKDNLIRARESSVRYVRQVDNGRC